MEILQKKRKQSYLQLEQRHLVLRFENPLPKINPFFAIHPSGILFDVGSVPTFFPQVKHSNSFVSHISISLYNLLISLKREHSLNIFRRFSVGYTNQFDNSSSVNCLNSDGSFINYRTFLEK